VVDKEEQTAAARATMNVRELRAILHRDRRSDQVDYKKLARYSRLDSSILLRPLAHRAVKQQKALTTIRARDLLV
jgi:hypothetical protein